MNDCSAHLAWSLVQVADALGDTKILEWTNMLGLRAYATDWQGGPDADCMTYSLLSLPPHLLHPVLSAANGQGNGLWDLIDAFPAQLHSAVLTACTEDKTLSVPAKHARTLELLPSIVFPPPGLLRLHVAGHTPRQGGLPSQASAAILARALIAQPSLTQLLFTTLLEPKWLSRLSACLSATALPSLASLGLVINAPPHGSPAGCPGAAAAVVRSLKCFPSLRSLQVGIQRHSPRTEQHPALSTLLHSAACPAALSSLEYLNLTEGCEDDENDADSDDDEPNDAALHKASLMLHLLPLLHAPALTSLELTTAAARLPMHQLCFALRHLTTLRRLFVNAQTCRIFSCEGQLPPQLPPSVQVLEVASESPNGLFITGAALVSASPTALTRLSLARPPRRTAIEPDPVLPPPAEWMLQCLTLALRPACTLRSLSMNGLCSAIGPPGSTLLCGALARLTGLTHLSLQCEYEVDDSWESSVLRGPIITPGLLQLQDLQCLRLCDKPHLRLFDDVISVLEACSALQKLSRVLVLCKHEVDDRISAVMKKLQGLRRLSMISDLIPSQLGEQLPGVSVERGCYGEPEMIDDGSDGGDDEFAASNEYGGGLDLHVGASGHGAVDAGGGDRDSFVTGSSLLVSSSSEDEINGAAVSSDDDEDEPAAAEAPED